MWYKYYVIYIFDPFNLIYTNYNGALISWFIDLNRPRGGGTYISSKYCLK